MNWTGGRLSRHSSNNNAGALTRTQKQLFAKSRLKASKGPRQVSPLQILSQFEKPSDDASQKKRKRQGSSVLGETRQSPPHKHNAAAKGTPRTSRNSSSHTKSCESPKEPANLHGLKRRLLREPDWAAVSAARPLKILFTPVGQQARFGKRRKLTEADRRRLASTNKPLFTPEFGTFCGRKRPYQASEAKPFEGIDIRINAHRPDSNPARNTGERTPRNGSSHSMLLSCDGSTHTEQDAEKEPLWSQVSRRGTLLPRGSSLTPEKGSISCSENKKIQFPSSTVGLSSASSLHKNRNMKRRAEGSSSKRRYSGTSGDINLERTKSHGSLHQQSGSPISRRFTIDDQVLAEKEGTLNAGSDASCRQDTHGTNSAKEHERGQALFYLQQREYQPLYKQATNTGFGYIPTDGESSSSNQCSSWLPKPIYNIQRPLGQETAGDSLISFPSLSEPQSHERSTSPFSNEHSTNFGNRLSASPMKIYGQSIFPNHNEIVDQARQLSPDLAKLGLRRGQQTASRCALWDLSPSNQFRSNVNTRSSCYQRDNTDRISSPRLDIEPRSDRWASHYAQPCNNKTLNRKRSISTTSASTSHANTMQPHSSRMLEPHVSATSGGSYDSGINEVTVYGQSLSSSASPEYTLKTPQPRSPVVLLSSSPDPLLSKIE